MPSCNNFLCKLEMCSFRLQSSSNSIPKDLIEYHLSILTPLILTAKSKDPTHFFLNGFVSKYFVLMEFNDSILAFKQFSTFTNSLLTFSFNSWIFTLLNISAVSSV